MNKEHYLFIKQMFDLNKNPPLSDEQINKINVQKIRCTQFTGEYGWFIYDAESRTLLFPRVRMKQKAQQIVKTIRQTEILFM